MKAMALVSFVVLLSACAGHDRREDLRSELQTIQPDPMLSATQAALPVRAS